MPVEANLGILDRGQRIRLIHAHQKRAELSLGRRRGIGALLSCKRQADIRVERRGVVHISKSEYRRHGSRMR